MPKRLTTHPEKARRRAGASERQEKRDARTTLEQLRLIAGRRGDSHRERSRLERSLSV
jgi:hypothetical protein